MTETVDATARFRAARDQLLELRGDHERRSRSSPGPTWASGSTGRSTGSTRSPAATTRPALVIVEEDGSDRALTFDELARRSDQVAAWLRDQGVGKGDAVIVMLGNQVELWETMLAVMKLGAVIMPTTTAVGPGRARRPDRARRRPVRGVQPGRRREVRRGARATTPHRRRPVDGTAGMARPARRRTTSATVTVEHPGPRPDDRLLLYFTSGTTTRPKLVEHTQVSYPVGHLSTMYWLGLQPGDVHLNISSPGWAKHAWSCFFAPWIAEATVLGLQLRALRRGRAARRSCASARSRRSARRRPCGGC